MRDSHADAFGLLGAVVLLFGGLAAVSGWQIGAAFTALLVLAALYCSWRRIL